MSAESEHGKVESPTQGANSENEETAASEDEENLSDDAASFEDEDSLSDETTSTASKFISRNCIS